ncbi:MAG: hypothetical protein R2838_07415 [Caldilineaceae bacterium]
MVDAQRGYEIYAARQRHYLLLAMQPGAASIHLMPEKCRGVDQPRHRSICCCANILAACSPTSTSLTPPERACSS